MNGKQPWEKLMFSNFQQSYRFPLLEAVQQEVPNFDPRKDEAPSDEYSTTTSSKPSIYDQIIISRSLYDRINTPPIFGTDVGIVDFDNDNDFEWFIDNWHNVTKMLSDHRPIWIKMSISDDD